MKNPNASRAVKLCGTEQPDVVGRILTAGPLTAEVVQKTAAKRVCIVIKPERVVSWDHRKVGGTYYLEVWGANGDFSPTDAYSVSVAVTP